MELKKCKILIVGVIVIILSFITLWNGKAVGQEKKYPNKPIEVIIHFAAQDAGFTVEYMDPEALKKKMAEDYKSMDKIVKAAGLGRYSK